MSGCCWAGGCARTDTRRYLVGPACPQHTPAALAGHPEPDSQVDPDLTDHALRRARTPQWARSAVEVNKSRPGGYVSRQRAERIAEDRARQSLNVLRSAGQRTPEPVDQVRPGFVSRDRVRQVRLVDEESRLIGSERASG